MTVGRAYAVAGSLSRFYYSSRGRLYVVYSFLHGVFLQPARVSSTVLPPDEETSQDSALSPSTRTSNEGLEHSSELSGLAAQPGTLAAPLASGRWRAGGGARAPRRRGPDGRD